MYETSKPKILPFLVSGRFNYIRCIEVAFCIICLALAIIVNGKPLHLMIKILLLTISSAFLFMTLIDLASWCVYQPIRYKTWKMLAVVAFLLFWLCGGFMLLLKRQTHATLMLITCLMNIITGFVYLFDCVWTTMLSLGSTAKVAPARRLDRGVSCYLCEINDYDCTAKKKPSRHGSVAKPSNTPNMSHGGTFHVSKELAPLSSAGSKKPPCHCLKTREPPSSSSPGRRRTNDQQLGEHSRSRSPRNSLSSRMMMNDIGDSNEPYKLPTFKNSIEKKHNPYYLSYLKDGKKLSQTLDTVPERDSKCSVDSIKDQETIRVENLDENVLKSPSAEKTRESSYSIKAEKEGSKDQISRKSMRRSSKFSQLSQIDSFDGKVQTKISAGKTQESIHSIKASAKKSFSYNKTGSGAEESDLENNLVRKLSTLQEVLSETNSKTMQESTAYAPVATTRDAIQHQYYQMPCCKCGKIHYQQQTIVAGSIARSPCGSPLCPSIQHYEAPQKLMQQSNVESRSNMTETYQSPTRAGSIRCHRTESHQKLATARSSKLVRNASTEATRIICPAYANNDYATDSRRNIRQMPCPSQRVVCVRDQSSGSTDPCKRQRRDSQRSEASTNIATRLFSRQSRQEMICECNPPKRRNGLDEDYSTCKAYPSKQTDNCDCCCPACREMSYDQECETDPPVRGSCSLTDSLNRKEMSSSATPDSVDEEIMVSPLAETKEVNAVSKDNRYDEPCICCNCSNIRDYCAECEPCVEAASREPVEFVPLPRNSRSSQNSMSNNIKSCHAEPICSFCGISKQSEDKSVNTAPKKKKRFLFGKKRS